MIAIKAIIRSLALISIDVKNKKSCIITGNSIGTLLFVKK